MAIKRKAGGRITGLSTDSKPTAAAEPLNTIFQETDTHDDYINNGTAWIPSVPTQSYNAIIYKVGSTYKSKKADGTLLASSTTLDGVVQAALDVKGTVLWPASANGTSYQITSAAAWKIYPDTKLIMGAWIVVPPGYANSLFTVDDTTGGDHVAERIYVSGGYMQESGTPQALWTGLEVKSTASTPGLAGVTFCTFRDMFIKRCNVGVKLTCNAGTASFISGCTFDSITVYVPHIGFEFDCPGTGSLQVASRNTFINCIAQADQTQPGTDQLAMINGYRNISNKNNAFIHCKAWDIQGANTCSNTTATAEDTIILGGLMTVNPTTWEITKNLGKRTWVIGDVQGGAGGAGGIGSNVGLNNPMYRKTGSFTGASAVAAGSIVGDGLLSTLNTTGTITNVFSTDGIGKRMDTTATINSLGRIGAANPHSCRYFNPFFTARFKLNQSTAQKIFVGFASVTPTVTTADDPLVSLTGYGLYHSTTHATSATNWLVCRNTGTASSTFTNTGIAANITTPQIVHIAAFEDVPAWYYRVGTNAAAGNTTTIPGQLDGLMAGIWMSNSGAAAKTCDVYAYYLKHSQPEEPA